MSVHKQEKPLLALNMVAPLLATPAKTHLKTLMNYSYTFQQFRIEISTPREHLEKPIEI